MHVLQVEDGVVPALHNLVPEHDLVQIIVLRLVLGRQVEEQLFHVPVEQRIQVSVEIECDVAQVALLPVGAVVGDVLPAKGISRSRIRMGFYRLLEQIQSRLIEESRLLTQ